MQWSCFFPTASWWYQSWQSKRWPTGPSEGLYGTEWLFQWPFFQRLLCNNKTHLSETHLFGLGSGLKLELQLLCKTMSFGFTCKCVVWGCGCPSVVVIGNWDFGFTCKCMVWGCSCHSRVVLGNCVLLYLSHCIQTGIKSSFLHKLFTRFPMAK